MSNSFPARVRIVEVGPRDGLQNEPVEVGTDAKVALIEALAGAGVKSIECGSFVSPKWVPQMADTAAVMQRIRRVAGVRYSVLVPNLKGLAAALKAGVEEIAVFASASEDFSHRNINCSIAESLTRLRAVAETALANGLRVRGYVSCALDCPHEGPIAPAAVTEVAQALVAMGCGEISLGDTIGTGTPLRTRLLIEDVAGKIAVEKIAVHFHDTWGQALANILAALEMGVSTVDAAVAGLGGCPYAQRASGNVATEDVVYMLDGMGIETGIDLKKLAAAGNFISQALGKKTASKAGLALGFEEEMPSR